MRRLNTTAGISYVEVLAAVFIFTIALMTISRFMEGAVRINNVADRGSRAEFIAQQQLEVIKSSPWDSIKSGSNSTTDGFNLNWSVTVNPANSFSKTCTLSVTWTDMSHTYARAESLSRAARGINTNVKVGKYKISTYVFIINKPRS